MNASAICWLTDWMPVCVTIGHAAADQKVPRYSIRFHVRTDAASHSGLPRA